MDEHVTVRKLSRQHLYTSIKMQEAIALKAKLSGTGHEYLGFLKFRNGSEKLRALYSSKKIGIIENYLLSSIELVKETANKHNNN